MVNTLDLQQSQPLIGGQVMDPHGDTHDRECCCITLKVILPPNCMASVATIGLQAADVQG